MADLSRIQFKRTSTKGRKPDASTMNPGELAINLADQYLLTKNDSGAIINLSCPPVYDSDVTMAGKVKGNNYILSKTANYREDQTARDLNYFGAFHTNRLDDFLDLTLNVPHSSGIRQGRGFTFQYGNLGSRVETYGYNPQGQKAFSYKMYHEGDKPTPSELNVYSKQEVDRMFVKNVKMSTPSSASQGYGYFKIATAMIPQQGRMAFIRIYGGNGYNVNSPSQADLVEIVIRGGNGNPKGVTVAAYRRNSLNQLEVFAINTSGDNYDIYVKYGRFTDNVIVEFGKTVGVNLTIHDVPDFSEEKPAGTTFEGRIITMFNTENKRGSLYFDHNAQVTYDIVSLCNDSGTGKKYLRKFRSGSSNAIWHETVQHDTYRLATGTTDSSEVLRITGRTMYTGKAVFDAGSNTIRMQRPTGQSNYLEYWDVRNGASKRQGWIGFGSIENDNFQWYSDEGKNSIQLDTTGQISLTTGARKYVYTNGQYVAANSNAFRMIYGNYGSFWRNDGTNVYLFSTAENDTYGQWNTYRPFIYNLVSGDVKLGGTDTAYCLHLGVDGSTRIGDNLVFRAGSRQSMDYLEFVHWGNSNTGRNNVLSMRDSKGFLAEFERVGGTNGVKTRFFGETFTDGTLYLNQMNNSSERFSINNWGNSEVGRAAVMEVGDSKGYHFYTERRTDNSLAFDVAGAFTVHGPNGITIKNSAGARHIWFRDDSDAEKAVIWATDEGILHIRNNYGGSFSHHFRGAMILAGERVPYNSEYALIRGNISGGAWVDWRDRPAGLLVDCQDSRNQAYNIWKATHWGEQHLAAMGVHAGGGNPHVVLHVGGNDYAFASNGDFTAGAAVYCNDVYIRSDRRLKINVEDYEENAVDKVNKLKVKTYDKVKSLSDREVIGHEIGIIAQDLQEVLPEAVSTSSVGSQDNPEEILTISNSAVNALLIKAVQEMSEENKLLRERLTAIEAKLG